MEYELVDEQKPTKYHVFHDESGAIGTQKWFITGLALVKEEDLSTVVRQLRSRREDEEDPKHDDGLYKGEIHYTDLRNFPRQTKSRVAKKWFLHWYKELKQTISVSLRLFDQKHEYWDDSRYSKDFHAYNKMTSMSLDGFLSYNLQGNSPVDLVIHSDDKSRSHVDNFESYMEEKIKKKLDEKDNLPPVNSISTNSVTTNNHREKFQEESEVIQLVDLLMGSCRASIKGNVSKEAKVWMGRSFSHIINSRNGGNCPVGKSNLTMSVFPHKKSENGKLGFSDRLNHKMKPEKPRAFQKKTLKDSF